MYGVYWVTLFGNILNKNWQNWVTQLVHHAKRPQYAFLTFHVFFEPPQTHIRVPSQELHAKTHIINEAKNWGLTKLTVIPMRPEYKLRETMSPSNVTL